MNIKDYLHLYIGCPYVLKNDSTQTVYPELKPQYLADRYGFIDVITPILKRFSYRDMPEEEKRRFEEETEDTLNYYLLTPIQTAWLLKNGYDIFKLIDAGLAIDATTLLNNDKNPEESDTTTAK